MEKEQKQIIITTGLVLVLIFAWIRSISVVISKAPKRPSVVKPATVLAPVVASYSPVSVSSPKTASSLQDEAQLKWRRDPFSGKFYAGASSAVEVDDLDIKGILWDIKNPQALIGDAIVKQGDVVGQYTIVFITKDSIIVNDGNKDIEIKLK